MIKLTFTVTAFKTNTFWQEPGGFCTTQTPTQLLFG